MLTCVRVCSAQLVCDSDGITPAVTHQFLLQNSNALEQGRGCKSAGRATMRELAADLHPGDQPRARTMADVAALGSVVLEASQVSSPATPRHPSAVLHMHLPCVLSVLLRSCGGRRQDDALSTRAARGGFPCTGACLCSAAGTSARRGPPRQAEPRRASQASAATGRHGAALGRAEARPCCPAHSPNTQSLHPRGWGGLGVAWDRLWHACAVSRTRKR